MSEPVRKKTTFLGMETLILPDGSSRQVGVYAPGHYMPADARYEDRNDYRWFYSGEKFSIAIPLSSLTPEHLSLNP